MAGSARCDESGLPADTAPSGVHGIPLPGGGYGRTRRKRMPQIWTRPARVGSAQARSRPPSPSARPSVASVKRSVASSRAMTRCPSRLWTGRSMTSLQRRARRSGSSLCSSAAVMARIAPDWMAAGLTRAGLPAERQHGGAHVARVQLQLAVLGMADLVRDADPDRFAALAAWGQVLALGDHHVAAVAAAPVEIAPGRRALAHRRHA